MTKAELISAVADSTDGLSKAQVEQVIIGAFDTIRDELAKDNDVSIAGFGKFEVAARAGRQGRNPQTGEKISIPPRKAVVFKSFDKLKSAINS